MPQDKSSQHTPDNNLTLRLRKVSPEIFAQFLYEHGIPTVSCLACHGLDMAIPQITTSPHHSAEFTHDVEAMTYLDYIHLESGPDTAPGSLLNYQYRLICKSCGFTSNFSAYPIVQWIEQKTTRTTTT